MTQALRSRNDAPDGPSRRRTGPSSGPDGRGRPAVAEVLGGRSPATVLLEDEVREPVRRRGLDPARDAAGVQALVADAIADYDNRSLPGWAKSGYTACRTRC